MKGTIYLLRNKLNNMCYVGQTRVAVEKRVYSHFNRKPTNTHISRAVHKYGKEGFVVYVLDTDINSQEQLDELEKAYIIHFGSLSPNGYNLMSGGSGNRPNQREVFQKIPDTELNNVVLLYDATGSLNELAAKYNCSNSSVLRYLKHHKVDRKTARGKQRVCLTKEEFISLYNQHKTNRKLAEILKVKDNTITYYKKKYGLPCNNYPKRNTRSKE